MTAGITIADTNLLIYAADHRVPTKRDRARYVLSRLVETRTGVLTAQVLAEFFDVITHKQHFRLDPFTAAARVAEYRRDYVVLDMTPLIVDEAIRGSCTYGFRIYDAQLWATARLSGIGLILSEDFQDGCEIEGVRFLDPFSPDFDLEAALGR